MMMKTIQSLLTLLTMLMTTAYLTLMERKMLASSQMRKGPNIVGIYGLLQPMADAIKLMMKESMKHHKTTNMLFLLSPSLAIIMAMTAWSIIPLDYKHPQSDTKMGMMMLLTLSSLSIYTILLSGWASNSKYALLGSIRATAQMMSYEVCMGMMMLTVVSLSSSLNLSLMSINQNKMWYMLPLLPMFIMFTMSSMAETNRTPFDLTESESELVSGFNVEYSAMLFTLLFLAEYINMLLMASMMSMLFLSGSNLVFLSNPSMLATKIMMMCYLFICMRATYARMRYDQLMNLLWKSYLPLSLALMILAPILEMSLMTYT
uniref:NADH-ubiquinone oxidoreductase chain 1 n=1 Tax=Aphrocallistes beatrix TaxID=398365 RepID=A0A0N6W8Y6_9METZ|nr:NADH dehydrogenase subunit 1 [Aphrocallistes beatrix]